MPGKLPEPSRSHSRVSVFADVQRCTNIMLRRKIGSCYFMDAWQGAWPGTVLKICGLLRSTNCCLFSYLSCFCFIVLLVLVSFYAHTEWILFCNVRFYIDARLTMCETHQHITNVAIWFYSITYSFSFPNKNIQHYCVSTSLVKRNCIFKWFRPCGIGSKFILLNSFLVHFNFTRQGSEFVLRKHYHRNRLLT